jgi:hypothetical protein
MKTSNQKYRRSHWWKYTDWEAVELTAIFVALLGGLVFGLGWVIAHPNTDDGDKADSVADTTAIMDSVQTKSDTADFDTVISNTHVVIKANVPIKVVVK